jgi:uncharacterized protein with GYD domain
MAKYILLVNWTDEGIRNIKDLAKRLDAGRALAKEHGCVLESFFMTMGSFDNVAVIEAPDDETIARYVLTSAQRAICAPSRLRPFPSKPIGRSSLSWLRPDTGCLRRRLRPGTLVCY